MINELYSLTVAMKKANIDSQSWYREYKELPKVYPNSPCIRIVLNQGKIVELDSLSPEEAARIRKFGNNQGTFPAMNITPLYRLEDENIQEEYEKLLKNPKLLDIDTIKSWMRKSNWNDKFLKKYPKMLKSIPRQLADFLRQGGQSVPELNILLSEIEPFKENPQHLHDELTEAALEKLKQHTDIPLALHILFEKASSDKKTGDTSNLSVVLDSQSLEKRELPVIEFKFTRKLNDALLAADQQIQAAKTANSSDAFGRLYTPSEDPMPKIKLPAGFDATLRTMFKGQPCQYRYGQIGNNTYPLSLELQKSMKDALEWIGAKENEKITWLRIDKDEALFTYPSKLPKVQESMVALFSRLHQSENASYENDFLSASKLFEHYFEGLKRDDPEYYPDNIETFILRKLDKARTKVVFSYNATPSDLIQLSKNWYKASQNVPNYHFCHMDTPFPLEVADTLNKIWRQDGKPVPSDYRPFRHYHGMELLLAVTPAVAGRDLHSLVISSGNLAPLAGNILNTAMHHNPSKDIPVDELSHILCLIGMMLYWIDPQENRKEHYMHNYPYLMGQMLKAADGLHELYCHQVRNNDVPPKLVGSSLYLSALIAPVSTFAQLGTRLAPYLAWAKSHPNESFKISYPLGDGTQANKKSPSAGYYLRICNQLANELAAIDPSHFTHFNDCEKAQLFLGYLADFPKLSKNNGSEQIGGNENE